MKKNLVIIILLVGVVCIIAGIYLNNSPKQTEKKPQSEEKTETTTDTIMNPSRELSKEKCTENICINDLIITRQVGIYSISATVQNKGEEVNEIAIALVFPTTDGGTIRKIQHISHLDKNASTILEIQFTSEDKELLESSDYKLEKATPEECNQSVNNIVD